MPGLQKSSSQSQLPNPMGKKEDEPRIRSGGDVTAKMTYTTSFTARVRETTVENNTSNEYEKVIAVKKSNVTAFLIMRNVGRTSSETEPKNRTGKISQYAVQRCIKITSSWREVESQASMAIQFEKVDLTSSDLKRNNRSPFGKDRNASKASRTKVMTVVIRNWTIESVPHVKEIWEMCHEFAQQYYQAHKADRRAEASRRKAGLGSSIIDEKTRRRERNRVSRDPRLPMTYSRATGARLSQGRKIMAALSGMDTAKPRSSYAALSGATGRTSFAKSLIGSPNLSEFDLKPKTKRTDARTTERRIEKALDKRIPKTRPSKQSVFSTTPFDVDGAEASVSSPTTPRKKYASASDNANIPNTPSPFRTKKRRAEIQESPERQTKRNKNISEQLIQHLESSQTTSGRKRLRPFVRDTPASAGIANEGNTCYLSAVVQALMSDSQLISCLRKRFVPEVELSFSSALITMENDRDSSTILKAGNIRNAISKHFPEFSSSNQQDAHEFLLRCLDVVARECTLNNFRASPTHTLYSLVQERKFTCTSCGHGKSPRKEILRGLSLDIPEKDKNLDNDSSVRELSVEGLLKNFFASQVVDLNCENCSGKQARSDSKIVVAPRVLVLHIKRFGVRYNGESGGITLEKISDAVGIPHRLSLDPLLSKDAMAPTVIEKLPKPSSATSKSFRKSAVAPIDNPPACPPSKPNAETIAFPTSPTASKSQPFCQATQVSSPVEEKRGNINRSRNFDFARRFRIHAEEPTKEREAADCTVKRSMRTAGPRVNRRLQLEDDGIVEDDIVSSPVGASGASAGSEMRSEHVNKIVELGLPIQEAKNLLRKTNFDLTVAMGLAMDRRNEAEERPADLDGDLLRHISTLQNGNAAPCDRTTVANYKLGAVIRHHSNSLRWGHYVADIFQRDGTWFCYDDSTVSEMNDRSIQDQEGYLCWYMLDG